MAERIAVAGETKEYMFEAATSLTSRTADRFQRAFSCAINFNGMAWHISFARIILIESHICAIKANSKMIIV